MNAALCKPRSFIPALLFTASLTLVFLLPSFAYAETSITPATLGTNISNTVWTKAGSPYIVDGNIRVRFGSLSIDPGVVVKFTPGSTFSLHADVATNFRGTLEDPIYFTSLKDDSVGGDTNGDGATTSPAPGDWGYISLGSDAFNGNMQLAHIKVRYGGGVPSLPFQEGIVFPAFIIFFQWFTGTLGTHYEVHDIEVSHSADIGLYLFIGQNNSVSITNSSFYDNAAYGVRKTTAVGSRGQDETGALNLSGNWWGTDTGPQHPTLNPAGTGNSVFGTRLTLNSWLFEDPLPDPSQFQECCSSVIFLPGIQGSRLYEGNERLWEGNDEKVSRLSLDETGASINSGVYTKDIVDIFDHPIRTIPIYKSFLDDLTQKKTNKVIADYATIPYDWRLAFPNILASGREELDGSIFYNRATSTPYVEQTLRKLVQDSQTGKVTVVAHSNGGLLAKALISQLGGEANRLIDQVIFIGVPQLGTPQALGTLLHGFDAGIPLVLSPERARNFAHNATAVYQLLPHTNYYNNVGATITTPVISFEGGASTQSFIDVYGTIIDDGDELHNFLSAQDGRNFPAFNDLDSPAIANGILLAEAENFIPSIGSSWQPPAGITVHQIAGIGESTLAGITYKTIQECIRRISVSIGFSRVPLCLQYQPKLSYTPEEVVDGDGVVVVPSALGMNDSQGNTKSWWVDLRKYNDTEKPFNSLPGLNFLRIDHKDFFEVPELRAFVLNNLITKSSTVLPNFISSTQPAIIGNNRLRFVLHSPLALSATDSEGNEISETVSTVPGATYKRYSEVQVVTVPGTALPTVVLHGIADGSFTLEVEEYSNNVFVASTTFSGVPSLASTVATMSFFDGTIQNAGNLEIDYNGDGEVDIVLEPEAGMVITLPDPSLTTLIAVLKETVHILDMDKKFKKKLIKKIEKLEKKIEKKKEKNRKILKKIEKKISKKMLKGKINSGDAEALLGLLEELEMQADEITFDQEVLVSLKDAIIALNAKENLKNNLPKRVAKLENKQRLIKKLSQLSSLILKKGEKGEIDDTSVQELLELLEQIENTL